MKVPQDFPQVFIYPGNLPNFHLPISTSVKGWIFGNGETHGIDHPLI